MNRYSCFSRRRRGITRRGPLTRTYFRRILAAFKGKPYSKGKWHELSDIMLVILLNENRVVLLLIVWCGNKFGDKHAHCDVQFRIRYSEYTIKLPIRLHDPDMYWIIIIAHCWSESMYKESQGWGLQNITYPISERYLRVIKFHSPSFSSVVGWLFSRRQLTVGSRIV